MQGYPYLHSASANKNVHSSNASRTTHPETQFQTIPALYWKKLDDVVGDMSGSVFCCSPQESIFTGFKPHNFFFLAVFSIFTEVFEKFDTAVTH